MQDPNLVNRPLEHSSPDGRVERPVQDRDPVVVNNARGGGSGGWAVAVILAVLVAVGAFYFVGSGTPDNVDPNANTSSITTPETAPAGGTATDGQTGGATTGGTQQPLNSQPAEGGGATTTTP
ncbi:hypothetical protein GR158_22370 [Shinella sp. AETb1-6]|jgi:hypothetical protein|uniref:Uncharacterized protein n=1 Tax=Shinella sumterensis TaxID=1967501 RepID=A0AA50CIY8_9HYPH|nr:MULTISPECIES: hypothetical protein [Shinella]MCD1264182.1 hypothetical protein [Shinella sumterensis]MDP9589726.1 hypothetical protein [Shinella zoogloeoides]MXN53852.1 hypothetical protein [Shinella sp. AETb1-6]WLR95878.1 hypothetical protein Q9313_08965 [Shinella sumterensis]